MSSPSQRRLAELLKTKAARAPQYKPLQSLPRAQMFTVNKFSYKQSNYSDLNHPDGKKPYVTIVHFNFAETNMYTFLTKEYQNVDEEAIKGLVDLFNDDIEDGVHIKFAYYGQLDGGAKAKIHFNDEEIDQKLLQEVQIWEDNSAQLASSPRKSGPLQSPAKKPRFESPKKD